MSRARKIPPVTDGAAMMNARHRVGISRLEAGQRLGLSESAINSYEQGRSDPSVRVLAMMSWLYRVPMHKLLRPRAAIEAEFADAIAAAAEPADDPERTEHAA